MINVFSHKNTEKFYATLHKEIMESWGFNKKIKNPLKNDPIFKKNLKALIRGKGISERIASSKPLSDWEKLLRELFTPFSESVTAIENIHMISIFVRQYPNYQSFKSNQITPAKYLRYHVENYLNELYIFEKRINRLLSVIEKLCKKNKIDSTKELIRCRKILENTLGGAIRIRGKHVHQSRFEEDSLDRLTFLDFMSKDKKMEKKLFVFNKIFYRIDRAKWARNINKSANNLSLIFDTILKEVDPIIFNQIITKVKINSHSSSQN